MKLLIFPAVFLCLTLIVSFAEAKVALRNCSTGVASEITDVLRSGYDDLDRVFSGEYNFVAGGLGVKNGDGYRPVLYSFSLELDQGYKRIIRDFLTKSTPEHEVVINCKPLFGCRDGVGAFVMHKALRGNKKTINLCAPTDWDSFLNCELQNDIFHELAHLAGMPIMKGHSNARHPNFEHRFRVDSVYQFGTAMGNACFEKTLTKVNSN